MDDLKEELDALERTLCGQKEPDSLDFRLLRRLTGNFSDDRRIGEGGCGEVYKGELPNGKLIAVKKLKKDYHNIIDEKMFRREVDSMIKVRHENIVRFLGYCSEIKEKAFVMPDGTLVMAEEREKLLCFPYISNGSLDKHLTDELRGFEWHTRYQIIKGICHGLLHLHKEKGIMHMDLKPANILLGDQMVPMITDFGVSRIDGKTQITSAERLFSRGYAAPEYIDTGVRSWKSDIYSLGVIMIELVTGSRALPNTTKVLRRWRHRWNKSSKHTPLLYLQVKKCLELAVRCQEINPVNRPFISYIVHELNKLDSWDGQIRESSLDKIISSSDDMLGIEPLEFHFTLAHNKKQISWSIELTNDTDYFMAFKISTTSLLPFSIQPDKGIAAPRSKCTTSIILSALEMTPLLQNLCKEEFTVQSTKIDGSLTAVDITDDTFNDEGANSQEKIGDGDKVVDEVNLTVLFNEMLHEEHQRDVANLSAEMGSLVTSSQDLSQLLPFPERPPTSGRRNNQHVVILSAFDCSDNYSTAWYTVDRIYWIVQKKLTGPQYINSCLGYPRFEMQRDKFYGFDMKLVDTEENMETGYKKSSKVGWENCTENIKSGLNKAQELIKDIHGYLNSVILLFSDDGLINNEGFFHLDEKFEFKVPVHTFTLGGAKYNKDLEAIAKKSKGQFDNTPVPERPGLSERFLLLLDSIIDGTTFEEPCPGPEMQQRLDVVLVYAFDSTKDPQEWHTMKDSIFRMVQERLAHLEDSCMGFIYHNANPNNYITGMKVVDHQGLKDDTCFDKCWSDCEKDMASGLKMANKMLRNRGNKNGIILFFSDGLKNKGDFFDGTEDFKSEFPVHTFTLGGDAYNEDLEAIAKKSKGEFHSTPVPERPTLSERFPLLLDSIIYGTTFEEPRPRPETQQRLDVVLVYAFDSTEDPPAWYTMKDSIFWMVQERLAHLEDSCMGFIYHNANPNNYITGMKVVDYRRLKDYTCFDRRWSGCEKDMASGLKMANKMLRNRGNKNGIILFFSDGLKNKGDFFDGTEDFKSEFPVHMFTFGEDAYNEDLEAIAKKSKGKFHNTPIPERPMLSERFPLLLDSIIKGTTFEEPRPHPEMQQRLDVVLVYAFDSTEDPQEWHTMKDSIFWMVQERLAHLEDSCMGVIYHKANPNNYITCMKVVDHQGLKDYMCFDRRCEKDMASGLKIANKMLRNRGHKNGIILFFSDGLKNKGDFFDGTADFKSEFSVHTFTLGEDAYNEDLEAIAKKSKGKFHNTPVPERPTLSERFLLLLDSIIYGTIFEEPRPHPETQQRLDVVLVYAFDSTKDPQEWHTMIDSIFWMVQERLAHLEDSCMGFIYHNADPNNYITGMKVVDHQGLMDYTGFDRRWSGCEKDMASGLKMANKMLRNRGNKNGIILFFSDGLKNKGDFFDGTEDFKSEFPVHTFTLGGDAYNEDLEAIAKKSKGEFHNTPVPERPTLSERFPLLLDSIIYGTTFEEPRPHPETQQRLDVVLVYAFDSTEDPPAWYMMKDRIFWMVQERLSRLEDSCMGFIYHNANPNNYITGMKVVDREGLKDYTCFGRRWSGCEKDMASGLKMANKMLRNRGNKNGIILFFSDGLENEGDFFDGTEDFKSEFPVHTFTLGGDAYNEGLLAIADKSGGTFDPTQVPEEPKLPGHFSQRLDSLLLGPNTN